jgi:hypothetical protein
MPITGDGYSLLVNEQLCGHTPSLATYTAATGANIFGGPSRTPNGTS